MLMAPNLFPTRVAQSFNDHEALDFRRLVMEDKWEEVIEIYNADSKFHKIEIKGRGTALHVAVSNGCKKEVKSLVKAIEKLGDETSLGLVNEKGATPLHLAAYRGFTDLCECIIGEYGERKYLIQMKNENGETPLFWAVRARKRLVFVYLQQFYPYDINVAINNNDTSILHVAIQREMFDLAIIIMYCYEGLVSMKDNDDIIPLEILATRTSAFKSGTRLSWWKQILYYCLSVSNQDARTTMELYRKKAISIRRLQNENDDFGEVSIPLYHAEELEKAYNVQHTAAPLHFFSRVKILCNRIQKYVFRWPILSCLNSTMAIKKKHIYGGQLLDEFMKNPYESYIGGGVESISNIDDEFESFSEFIMAAREEGETSTQEKNENKNFEDSTNIDGKNTAYLIAASHGIVEMMKILESRIRSVIHDINSNKENAFHLAVKNRQPHVIQWFMKSLRKEVFHQLNLEVDKNENTILHLAAYTSIQRENNWRISGVAMQLIWDIKWYKYIKGLVPEHFNHRLNVEGKTPSQIFKDQHKELLDKSIKWMNETAQSNSVVATLIAGASFATSASAPSGDQKTSDPTSEGHLAVEGFTISSLIGLYFSVGALIMFLSILSSRKEIEDFRQKLPMKLLFALSSLFVSIVAMFVSFCAGHFSVLSDKYNKRVIVFYLYISISLPIILYAAVQFSLFVDLVMVIWKKVPPPSVKGVHL